MDSLFHNQRWFLAPVLGAVMLLLLHGTLGAQELPANEDAAAEIRRKRLAERDRLEWQARFLRAGKQNEKATEALYGVLAIDRELFGDIHERVALTLRRIADWEEAQGDFRSAKGRLAEVLAIETKLLGAEHWKVTDARLAVRDLNHRETLTPGERELLTRTQSLEWMFYRLSREGKAREATAPAGEAVEISRKVLGEEHPHYAAALSNLASVYRSMGEFAAAEPLFRRAVTIDRKALGEEHPTYATNLNNLAALYGSMAEYAKAEPLYRQALAIRKRTLGEEHPDYAASLGNLAVLCASMGELAAAEPLFRQALAIRKKVLGEDHPGYATSLSSLAVLYHRMGEYAKAEPLQRQALAIRKKALGAEHPGYALSLNNLAALYGSMGQYAAAELLYRQALEIQRKALGEEHPACASTLNNLAVLYNEMGEYGAAEPLYRQALEIRKKALGEEHPDYASSLSSLALLYSAMGEYAAAEPLHRQALEIWKKTLGEDHPDYAVGLTNLGNLYVSRGEFSAAELLCRQAQEITRKALGEHHPLYATDLLNLASLKVSMGELAAAEPLCRQALEIRRKALDVTFAVLSERQQFQMTRSFRRTLDFYLSLSARTGAPPAEAHEPLLAWKGAIFARQARARVPREDPDVASIFSELESTGRRLATLCLSMPKPKLQETRRRQIRELTVRKEELERELSSESEAYREARAAEWLTPGDLQDALPPRALLVDFLEYEQEAPADKDGQRILRTERYVVAFLVPAEGEIRRVDLGPAAAITKAVDEWRRSISRKSASGAGRTLRKILWEPLSCHLEGVTTVLVSPDGALNRVPFAALPGEKPGTYLVEEISIAVVPVPQLLPGLLAHPPSREGARSLLLVGDVDYGGAPGEAVGPVASRSAAGTVMGTLPRFLRLPATQAEVAAIRNSFEKRHEDGEVRVLRRGEATEAAFRQDAPKHRWLHLATHGFFAPPSLKSVLEDVGGDRFGRKGVVGYHPGLLSGLALSGANTPPEADGDDGILTALEVASLDLSGVEVAVLSACDTGLGKVAGGEGVLGLQRAFQVAGAKTTVTSLWSVSDRATRMLMERFYGNLWEGKLSRLEALRQAQLWLLKEGTRSEDIRRGLGLPEAATGADEDGRLSPYYWAGFVLSGDWR